MIDKYSDFNTTANFLLNSEGFSMIGATKRLPIYKWKFKDQNQSHIGPMAQDFHRAFGLGKDKTGIAAIDADGVLFAAVKAQQGIIGDQQKEN